jgi:hypothetical protein
MEKNQLFLLLLLTVIQCKQRYIRTLLLLEQKATSGEGVRIYLCTFSLVLS